MDAPSRGAGVDAGLTVLVTAPREQRAGGVRGARVPAAQRRARDGLCRVGFVLIHFGVRFIRRFVIMLGCSFRRRGECGDGLWVGYPLVVDVVAECVVRVPSPGVQATGGCEDGAVARAREDGLG